MRTPFLGLPTAIPAPSRGASEPATGTPSGGCGRLVITREAFPPVDPVGHHPRKGPDTRLTSGPT
jgi:hypothetical protein